MPRQQGPKETAVRATLSGRLAETITEASAGARSCFAGFFNGASSRGSIWPDGSLKIGKSECEWDWEDNWAELKALGLIDWQIETKPNHPSIGGESKFVHLTITEKGRAVRADDLAYFRALMDAMDADEKNGN